MVATDKALSDSSSDAQKMLEEFKVEMSMRKDVFDNILAFSKSDEAKTFLVSGDEKICGETGQ